MKKQYRTPTITCIMIENQPLLDCSEKFSNEIKTDSQNPATEIEVTAKGNNSMSDGLWDDSND